MSISFPSSSFNPTPSVYTGVAVEALNSSESPAGESRPELASPRPPEFAAGGITPTQGAQTGESSATGQTDSNSERVFGAELNRQAESQDGAADKLKRDKEIERLKKRDSEVRAHEMAHLAAAGGYALGGPRYDFKTGPDGRRYAVGGRVHIDVSEVRGDPTATIQKARTIRRAALAPNSPSGQDQRVAARAASMEARAQRELNEKGIRATEAPVRDNPEGLENIFESESRGAEQPGSAESLTQQTGARRNASTSERSNRIDEPSRVRGIDEPPQMILTRRQRVADEMRDTTDRIQPNDVLTARLRAFTVESVGCLNCGGTH